MEWTRRDFLAGAAAGVVGARSVAPGGLRVCRISPASETMATLPPLEPFPATPLVQPFLRALANSSSSSAPAPTGLTRDNYLSLIDGIVRCFSACQDGRGAIIDPYEQRERQYSTPAFALAGAVLAASGRNREVLPRVVAAMNAASSDLASGKAADRHADFFTVLLLHADAVLGPHVPDATASAWRRDLARVVPEYVYVYQPGNGRSIHNWNIVAAAGEFLRTRHGYGRSDAWVEASLARQADHFAASGMYRDPNEPMAYDHFARLWTLDLVEEGYAGPRRDQLQQWLERAAWASLFMQSPHGELPCGGRSAHHQWNEAQQAVTCETFARRFAARGDLRAAGAFKRAARLSLRSIGRWVRPTGELWVVKNRVDPAARHGYESYSFHSQYNLLAASMLAMAWLRADESIGESRVPSETMGFAFGTGAEFHKAFAAAVGTYVEIETNADLHYDPTGIVRVHHPACPPELLSGGVSRDCDYTVPNRPSVTWAVGPSWRDASGVWHSLAEHGRADLEPSTVRVVSRARDQVEVEVSYRGRLRGGATGVRERVRVSDRRVDLIHDIEGDVRQVRGIVPFLVGDGVLETAVEVRGGKAVLVRGGGRVTVRGGGATMTRAGLREAARGGFVDALFVPGRGGTVRSSIEFDRLPPGADARGIR
jgi:hypothetical protein